MSQLHQSLLVIHCNSNFKQFFLNLFSSKENLLRCLLHVLENRLSNFWGTVYFQEDA